MKSLIIRAWTERSATQIMTQPCPGNDTATRVFNSCACGGLLIHFTPCFSLIVLYWLTFLRFWAIPTGTAPIFFSGLLLRTCRSSSSVFFPEVETALQEAHEEAHEFPSHKLPFYKHKPSLLCDHKESFSNAPVVLFGGPSQLSTSDVNSDRSTDRPGPWLPGGEALSPGRRRCQLSAEPCSAALQARRRCRYRLSTRIDP